MKNHWRDKLCPHGMPNFCEIRRGLLANREGSHLRVEEWVHAILCLLGCHHTHTSLLIGHKLAYSILFLSRKLRKSAYPNCERGKCVFWRVLVLSYAFWQDADLWPLHSSCQNWSHVGACFRVGASGPGPWVALPAGLCSMKVYSTVSSWHQQ